MLDAMDEEFGVNSLIAEEKAKQAKKRAHQKAKVVILALTNIHFAYGCICRSKSETSTPVDW